MGLGGRCNGLQTKWLVDHVGMERLWLEVKRKTRSLNFPSCPVSDRKCRHVLNIRYSLRGVSALAPVKTSIIELLILRNWMRYVSLFAKANSSLGKTPFLSRYSIF